jgi:hypothetical protein
MSEEKPLDLGFIIRDCNGDLDKAQRRIDREFATLLAKLEQERAINTVLVEALEFYACWTNWTTDSRNAYRELLHDDRIVEMHVEPENFKCIIAGKRASEALSKAKEMRDGE